MEEAQTISSSRDQKQRTNEQISLKESESEIKGETQQKYVFSARKDEQILHSSIPENDSDGNHF